MRAGKPYRLRTIGGDRQRRDCPIGAIGQQRRNPLWAGDVYKVKLDAPILRELARSLAFRAGRLVVLVENAERRRSQLGRDADLLVLDDAVERLGVRRLRAEYQG